jgi:hypothetical protein
MQQEYLQLAEVKEGGKYLQKRKVYVVTKKRSEKIPLH